MKESGIEYEFRPALEAGMYRVTLRLSSGETVEMHDLHSDWWILALANGTADGSVGIVNCEGGDIILTRHIVRIHYEKIAEA